MIRSLLLLPLLLCGCSGDGGESTPRRPNVIVLVMDTARGDHFSLYGYEKPTTPFLEELAETSTVFTDAWSPSPWTGPAHASLFTGLRPEHHGFMWRNRFFLSEESVTLAEILSAAGYETACLSNNLLISDTFGMIQGFGEYQGYWRNSDKSRPTSIRTHANAVEWVKEKRRLGEPYFLFINDMEPHRPYRPPEEVADRFVPPTASDALITQCRYMPGTHLTEYMLGLREISDEEWAVFTGLYDAEIATLDAEIRNLVDGLGGIDALDDTVVVILSDHGENLSDHGLGDHQLSVHRSVLHVALLLRFPGKFDGGRRVSETVRTEDLFPTILELCGLEVPGEIDGLSLNAKNLSGRPARAVLGRVKDDHVFRDYKEMNGSPLDSSATSVYDGRHHLLMFENGRVELYDVEADPAELVNLAEERPKVVRRLRLFLPTPP